MNEITTQIVTTDDARVFLKILEDRNNQMVTIIHQYTNYTVLTLSAIWTLLGKGYIDSYLAQKPEPIFLFLPISISIFVIISWRFYAHFIDDDIAKNYNRIISLEKVLFASNENISKSSTLHNLVKNCPSLEELLDKNDKKSYTQQQIIVEKLIKNRLIGTRGHFTFDFIASVIMIILIFCDLIIFIQSFYPTQGLFFGIIFASCTLILFLSILLLLTNPLGTAPVQRDPTEKQIIRIFKNQPVYRKVDSTIEILIFTILIFFIGIIAFYFFPHHGL